MLKKIIDKLDRERLYDYDVAPNIPSDSISINLDPAKTEIYLPRECEFAQYGIDEKVRELMPYTRTSTLLDRDIYIMKVKNPLKFDQFYDLIRYIIKAEGFLVFVSPEEDNN